MMTELNEPSTRTGSRKTTINEPCVSLVYIESQKEAPPQTCVEVTCYVSVQGKGAHSRGTPSESPSQVCAR